MSNSGTEAPSSGVDLRTAILLKLSAHSGYISTAQLRADFGVPNSEDSERYRDFRQLIKDMVDDDVLAYDANSKKAHELYRNNGSEEMIDHQFSNWKVRITSQGRKEVREEEQGSGNSINARDISGQVVQAAPGSIVTVTQGKNEEPLSLGPDHEYNGLMEISRFFYERLKNRYNKLFLSLTGGSGVASIISYYYAFPHSVSTATFSIFSYGLVALIISMGMLIVSLSMLLIPIESRCPSPKCGKLFSMRKVNRQLINQGRVGDEMVYNWKVFRECKNCGYKDSYKDVTREDIPTEDVEPD